MTQFATVSTITIVLVALTGTVFAQTSDWEQYYGDSYTTAPRPYTDIINFFILEAPGNQNPGNSLDLPQSDPSTPPLYGAQHGTDLMPYVNGTSRAELTDRRDLSD